MIVLFEIDVETLDKWIFMNLFINYTFRDFIDVLEQLLNYYIHFIILFQLILTIFRYHIGLICQFSG